MQIVLKRQINYNTRIQTEIRVKNKKSKGSDYFKMCPSRKASKNMQDIILKLKVKLKDTSVMRKSLCNFFSNFLIYKNRLNLNGNHNF